MDGPGQVAEEIRRRLVHEVDVFDGDQAYPRQQDGQQGHDHFGQLRAPEFLFELQGLTGLGHHHPDRHTDERSPREEIRRRSPQLGQEGLGQFLVTAFERKPEEATEEPPDRVVRRRRVVPLAHGDTAASGRT